MSDKESMAKLRSGSDSDQSTMTIAQEQRKTEVKRPTTGFAAYFRVFTYADTQSRLLYLLASVCLLACGVALPLLNIIFGDFVNQFNGFATGSIAQAQFQQQVRDTALKLVYIFVAKLVLFYIGMMAISVAALRTSRALRTAYVEKTLRQDIGYFDQEDIGSIAAQVTNSGDLIQQGTAEKLGVSLQALSTFIVAFIIAIYTQWKLALITICVVPAIVITSATCITIDAKQEAKVLRHYNAAGSLANEVLSSIRMVHAYWGQTKALKKYESILDAGEREGMKKSLNYGVLFSMQYFCVLAGYALAFWEGTRLYISGDIGQPGDIIVVVFAVLVAATSITQVAPQIATVAKSASAAETLFKVIDRESKLDPFLSSDNKIEKLEGRVRFEDVSFAYPSRPDSQVLSGLTIDFPANKTTALVGASGSGKSTIVGLLERWYSCSSGNITLDGQNITDLNVQWLRTQVRLVQQEPVLFNATVFENVKNGLVNEEIAKLTDDEQMERVIEACKSSNAHDFIQRLPQGYHTSVGERAGMLSGGQKQRIAIARSIISNPKILLLDEATSALDPVAEKKVQAALDKVRKARTTIIIAHKLSTIREADSIAVIEKGKIVEQGTHSELLASKGAYYRLVMAQDLGDKSDGHAVDNEDDSVTDEKKEAVVEQQDLEVKQKTIKGPGYGVVHCIFLFLGEQSRLWPGFLWVLIACLVGGLTYPALAILISRLIQNLQNTTDLSELSHQANFFSLMIFITAIVNLLAYFSMGYVTNMVSQKLTRRYRSEIFQSVLRQDIDFYDEPDNTTGAIVSRLSTAPTQLQELLGFNVAIIFITLVNLVSTCILALIVGWKLALVVLCGALLPIVISAWLRFAMESRLEKQVSGTFASSAAVASEAVSAIRTVVSLTLEQRVRDRYSNCLDDIVSKSTRSFIWINFLFAFAQSVVFAAMALTFWYGSQLVLRGEYDTDQFFIIFIAILFSGEACTQVSTFTTSLSSARAGANYILWLRSQKPKITESSGADINAQQEKQDGGAVQTQDLQFAYKSRPKALVINGVDVEAASGKFIAFVGASGCGKSTMASLIERFYERTGGELNYNGTDINTLDPRRYRQNIAMVQQEPTLLSGSVYDNVSFGLEYEPEQEEVEKALRQADAWTFVSSLPEGVSTGCGSSGTQLSGGQRQRIAIARALIRQPNVLLLDEATSALDVESEKLVQRALDQANKSRSMTTIAIAHRLATIKDADTIFVFNNGKIQEQGTHDELMAQEGMYYRMCLSQSLR